MGNVSLISLELLLSKRPTLSNNNTLFAFSFNWWRRLRPFLFFSEIIESEVVYVIGAFNPFEGFKFRRLHEWHNPSLVTQDQSKDSSHHSLGIIKLTTSNNQKKQNRFIKSIIE
jgi:hypothetical protein